MPFLMSKQIQFGAFLRQLRARQLLHFLTGVYRDVVEKEILNIVTSAEEADEIFEFIFYEADVNRPHGGIIFMTKLDRATDSLLPDLPEEGI